MTRAVRPTINLAIAAIRRGQAEKVIIPGQHLDTLPERFERYVPANELQEDGARESYRDGRVHVIKYDDYWKLHIDTVDPKEDPVGHLINDAPKEAALLALFVLGVLISRG